MNTLATENINQRNHMHFVMRKKNLFGTKEMRSKQLQTLQQKNAFHLIVSRSDLLLISLKCRKDFMIPGPGQTIMLTTTNITEHHI